MLPTVVCLATSRPQAEQIIGQLQTVGVPLADVSVLMLPPDADHVPAPLKGLSFSHDEQGEKTASAAATGSVTGAAAGVATMSIVGLTPLLIIAPIIVGAGAALGAAAGALASGLSDFGIAQTRLDYYQQRLIAGDLLVAVRSENEDELDKASSAFSTAGAREIETFRFTRKLR